MITEPQISALHFSTAYLFHSHVAVICHLASKIHEFVSFDYGCIFTFQLGYEFSTSNATRGVRWEVEKGADTTLC